VAVGLVVLAHARAPGFQGGFVGVDVFFVLSGYLITGLLVNERLASGTIHYGRFLARRLRRLLPALLAMLAAVLLAGTLFLTSYEMRMQSQSYPYAAAWVSNFFFAFAERDYFQALRSEDLFLHTWSLGVEEQFYVIWPWLILAFCALNFSRRSEGSIVARLFAAMLLVFVVSFALSIYLSDVSPILSFYMMPSRGWQFALGAIVYVGLLGSRRPEDRINQDGEQGLAIRSTGFIGLLLILGSAVVLTPDVTYPGYLALVPSLGAAALIGAGQLSADRGAAGLLRSRPLVWIGDRSYSIYLWHWPVFILGGALGVSRAPGGMIALTLFTLILAALSYRFVELPFWKGARSEAATGRVWAYAFCAIIVSIGAARGVEQFAYRDDAGTATAERYDPRLDAFEGIYGEGLGCDTWYRSAQVVPCGIGARDGKYLAVLWGDSVGAQWASLIAGIFPSPDWQVIVLTKSACAIVDEPFFYSRIGEEYKVCAEWRNNVLSYISQIHPEVVIVGNSAFYEFDESEWIEGSGRIFRKLSDATDHVVVIPGTPRMSFDGPACLEDSRRNSLRFRREGRECEEPLKETNTWQVSDYLREAAVAYGGVDVLDLADLVCPDRRCAARNQDGIVVFRDKFHLTNTFVKSLIPEVRHRLDALDGGFADIPGFDGADY